MDGHRKMVSLRELRSLARRLYRGADVLESKVLESGGMVHVMLLDVHPWEGPTFVDGAALSAACGAINFIGPKKKARRRMQRLLRAAIQIEQADAQEVP